MQRHADEGGYLLIEALAALAIVAVMAGMVFETVWQSGQAQLRAREQREATLLARSIMAAAQVSALALPSEGRDGGLAWQIASSPWSGDGESPLGLERVDVRVRAQNETAAMVRLSSLRSVP